MLVSTLPRNGVRGGSHRSIEPAMRSQPANPPASSTTKSMVSKDSLLLRCLPHTSITIVTIDLLWR